MQVSHSYKRDQHSGLKKDRQQLVEVDKPIAGLIQISARGLLDGSLTWGGEFGHAYRSGDDGRDHNPQASPWDGRWRRAAYSTARPTTTAITPSKQSPHPDLHATILLARARPYAADLSLRRPRLSPDRCTTTWFTTSA